MQQRVITSKPAGVTPAPTPAQEDVRGVTPAQAKPTSIPAAAAGATITTSTKSLTAAQAAVSAWGIKHDPNKPLIQPKLSYRQGRLRISADAGQNQTQKKASTDDTKGKWDVLTNDSEAQAAHAAAAAAAAAPNQPSAMALDEHAAPVPGKGGAPPAGVTFSNDLGAEDNEVQADDDEAGFQSDGSDDSAGTHDALDALGSDMCAAMDGLRGEVTKIRVDMVTGIRELADGLVAAHRKLDVMLRVMAAGKPVA